MTPSDCIPRDPATPDAKRRIVYGLWAVVALVAATFGGAQAAGFRLNMTASAPEGLWQIVEGAPLKTIRRGMIVSVCPPDAPVVRAMRAKGYLETGFCPSGTVPFLKPVAAIPGDVVTVASGQPLAVNGRALPNTVQEADMPPIPAGRYTVAPGTVWLLSSFDPGSFDSRYFGAVPIIQIRAQVIPVLVRGDPAALTPHVFLAREVAP